MLERLRLRNFQRHEDLRLVLDERITTIVGATDAGKSSIVRALRWITTGRPSGSAFVRCGENAATVTLWLDGRKLSRRKGKGANKIVLDGAEMEAFGSGLPESVTVLCNLGDVNFQEQHDQPFWLSLTAGQASREMNAVVNLDDMDGILSAVAREERLANANVELSGRRLREAENRLESLAWTSEMERDWKGAEEAERRLEEAEATLAGWTSLLEDVDRLGLEAEIELPDVSGVEESLNETTSLEKTVSRLEEMERERNGLKAAISDGVKKTRNLEVRLAAESGGVCPLCGGKI